MSERCDRRMVMKAAVAGTAWLLERAIGQEAPRVTTCPGTEGVGVPRAVLEGTVPLVSVEGSAYACGRDYARIVMDRYPRYRRYLDKAAAWQSLPADVRRLFASLPKPVLFEKQTHAGLTHVGFSNMDDGIPAQPLASKTQTERFFGTDENERQTRSFDKRKRFIAIVRPCGLKPAALWTYNASATADRSVWVKAMSVLVIVTLRGRRSV